MSSPSAFLENWVLEALVLNIVFLFFAVTILRYTDVVSKWQRPKGGEGVRLWRMEGGGGGGAEGAAWGP